MVPVILSIDAMGGDHGPATSLAGTARFASQRTDVRFLLHGDGEAIERHLSVYPALKPLAGIRHTPDEVAMDDKPSQALRKRTSSMWRAVKAVADGEAHAAVSAGNTGALMAISMLALRKLEGVYRPAMTALWPTFRGRTVVLDVGANLEADPHQLLTYAIMGEAYARAVLGIDRPSIGLLNIGAEEMKGHDEVRQAANLVRSCGVDLNYAGFVEGDDISAGAVDVVVTDGFTGNVALKSAEGTARLVGAYVKEALTSSMATRLGALMASRGLGQLRERLDPSNVNGGVLLGLNGIAVKSHGSADAKGFATALGLALDLSRSHFQTEVSESLRRLESRPGTTDDPVPSETTA